MLLQIYENLHWVVVGVHMHTAMLGGKVCRGIVELCICAVIVAPVVVCKDSIAGNFAAGDKDMVNALW